MCFGFQAPMPIECSEQSWNTLMAKGTCCFQPQTYKNEHDHQKYIYTVSGGLQSFWNVHMSYGIIYVNTCIDIHLALIDVDNHSSLY